jgi:hypothetical protein
VVPKSLANCLQLHAGTINEGPVGDAVADASKEWGVQVADTLDLTQVSTLPDPNHCFAIVSWSSLSKPSDLVFR